MSDIVTACTYCKNEISDTDGGVIWRGGKIYCSEWCMKNDRDEQYRDFGLSEK